MKKRVMNIRPQEVTVGGERSVQYKGSDGKMHSLAKAEDIQPVEQYPAIRISNSWGPNINITPEQVAAMTLRDFQKLFRFGYLGTNAVTLTCRNYDGDDRIIEMQSTSMPESIRPRIIIGSEEVQYCSGSQVMKTISRENFNIASKAESFLRSVMANATLTDYYYLLKGAAGIITTARISSSLKQLSIYENSSTGHDLAPWPPVDENVKVIPCTTELATEEAAAVINYIDAGMPVVYRIIDGNTMIYCASLEVHREDNNRFVIVNTAQGQFKHQAKTITKLDEANQPLIIECHFNNNGETTTDVHSNDVRELLLAGKQVIYIADIEQSSNKKFILNGPFAMLEEGDGELEEGDGVWSIKPLVNESWLLGAVEHNGYHIGIEG